MSTHPELCGYPGNLYDHHSEMRFGYPGDSLRAFSVNIVGSSRNALRVSSKTRAEVYGIMSRGFFEIFCDGPQNMQWRPIKTSWGDLSKYVAWTPETPYGLSKWEKETAICSGKGTKNLHFRMYLAILISPQNTTRIVTSTTGSIMPVLFLPSLSYFSACQITSYW